MEDKIPHLCMVDCEEYSVYLEEGQEGEAYVHILIREWNKSIYIRLLDHLTDLVNVFNGEVYGFVPKGNTKLAKFSEMFGFYQLKQIKDSNDKVIGDVYGYIL